MRHEGGCHCGALRLRFESDRPLAPRACRCGFCRRHNVRMVSDPDGAAELVLGPEARAYRFATSATDFLICRRCGVYVGAVAELDGRMFATLNLNAFDDARRDLPVTPVSYEGETPKARVARRRAKWTPARLVRA